MSEDKIPYRFEVEEILAAEYEYIAQTAFQAQEDRARVTTFYLVSVGSLFGAFFGTNSPDTDFLFPAFAVVFLFLTFFGFLTLRQLVSLRLSWFESAKAMDQIKDFLITQNSSLSSAFRWRTQTLPPKHHNTSVAYYLALQVAMLGGVTFGAAVFYSILAIWKNLEANNIYLFLGAAIAGITFLLWQMSFYKRELNK